MTTKATAQHTPGPWSVNGRSIQSDTEQYFVARVHDGTDVPYSSNARLIAAAPEMLALLQHFVGFVGDSDALDGGAIAPGVFPPWQRKTRALLARIEGR